MNMDDFNSKVSVIEPPKGWQVINLNEIKEYRDLFFFLVWRDIKVLYAQTILGFLWAILNPFIQIVIFSIIFGKVAQLDTGGIPYVLFSTVAIIPWAYMSQAMATSSQSLVSSANMLGKIYFPRLIFPLTPVLAKLVDFVISLLLLLAVLFFYKVIPTWNLLLLPIFVLMMISIPAGIGMWLSSLAIRFRDVKFAMPFLINMLIYTAPILYSADKIPENYRIIYSFNPIVGVIEGYRACLLGIDIPWIYITPGILSCVVIFVSGAIYFRHKEKIIVDVI